MRLRPMNMAAQPAALRPHVFSELLFCSRRNTSCRTSREGRWSQRGVPRRPAGRRWARRPSLRPVLGVWVRADPVSDGGAGLPGGAHSHSPGPAQLTPSPQLTPSSPPALHRATRRPGPGKGALGCDKTDPPGSSLGTQQRRRSPPTAEGGSCYHVCYLRASWGVRGILCFVHCSLSRRAAGPHTQGPLTPSIAFSCLTALALPPWGQAGDQSTEARRTGAPRLLTSAEKSPWCRRSRVSPDLVE